MPRLKMILLCSAAAVSIALLSFANSAAAETIYVEHFPNTSGSNSAMSTVDWASSNGAIVSPNPGYGGTIGFVATSVSGLIYTTENSAIDRTQYSTLTFSWYQNSSTISEQSYAFQLAVEIGSTWYVSANTFVNTSAGTGNAGNFATTCEYESVNLSAVTSWYTCTTAGVLSTTATTLPTSGNIVGVGVYATTSNTFYTRFDEFTVTGVPEPSATAMAITALGGLLAYGWRKRRKN